MNYDSQLMGWAVDRVIKMNERHAPLSPEEILEQADALAEGCYVPDTDFNDTVQRLAELLKIVPEPLEKVQGLMRELAALEEDIERQLKLVSAKKENVQ